MVRTKLLQQLNEQLNENVTVACDKVTFSSAFNEFLESLVINNLLNEEYESVRTDDKFVWGISEGAKSNVVIETTGHPMVQPHTDLTITGKPYYVTQALSLLEKHTAHYHTPSIKKIRSVAQFHDELHPKLWIKEADNNYRLRNSIRQKLLDIAQEFIKSLKIDIPYKDVVLTGSMAGFSWTNHSDIDLHIIVDMDELKKKYGSIIDEFLQTKRRTWNDLHSIYIQGFPVEVYVEDEHEEHVSPGKYSIVNDEWIKKPSRELPSVKDKDVQIKVKELIAEIKDAMQSNKAEVIEQLMKKIQRMRKAGLQAGGEFSVENIAYKTLRREGWLDRLAKCKNKILDRELSFEEEELLLWSIEND